MDFPIERAMQVATMAAEAAGQILCEMLETAAVREKAPKDLVTDADVAAQQSIERNVLNAFPQHRFLGEESDTSISDEMRASEDWIWVVDPLDGTANYVHRLPNFAVSIALVHRGQTHVGVVYDPIAKEMFTALQGRGASLNNRPIVCSQCSELERALVAASFPPQIQRGAIEIEQFVEILIRSQSIRRLGSAALNLCYVACGRLDAYWANQLKPWDMAAGLLIAQEANANSMTLNGDPASPWIGNVLVAASSELSQQIRTSFAEVDLRHRRSQ
jgi:myo-inositol-1(or 4)-monophosphatase